MAGEEEPTRKIAVPGNYVVEEGKQLSLYTLEEKTSRGQHGFARVIGEGTPFTVPNVPIQEAILSLGEAPVQVVQVVAEGGTYLANAARVDKLGKLVEGT